ncbi:MAG: hypothetical protein K2W96_05060 [Gemmataceae bacterium]|nr:hypothetical protein [Gemmataceae bacterium]
MVFVWLAAVFAFGVPYFVLVGLRAAPPPPNDEESFKGGLIGHATGPSDTIRRQVWLAAALFLLAWPTCTLAVGLLLYQLYAWNLALMPPSVFHLPSTAAVGSYTVGAIFPGIMAAVAAALGLLRLILGRRSMAELVQRLTTARRQSEEMRSNLFRLATIYGSFSAAFMLVCMPMHTRADEDGIHTRFMFGLAEEFPYAAIQRMAISSHDKQGRKHEVFYAWRGDGRRLYLTESIGPMKEFYAWVEARTGKNIRRVLFEEELGK